MRVGFVGVGRIGAAHAQVVSEHPAVEALVLADADPRRARAAAGDLGEGASWVERVEDAFVDVDAVVIAASTAAHADLVLRAVDAGIPAFCEKPVAPDMAGHRRVLAAARTARAPVQVGFQRRFDAGYSAAREAVRTGAIGELRRVHLLTADQSPPHADYIPRSGGIFRDCHVHDFDVLRWVTGREVREVFAVGANRGEAFFAAAGDVDESAAVLTLDDGTLATLQGSRYNGGGHDVRMEVAGTEGTWAVGLTERSPLVPADAGPGLVPTKPWPDFWERFTAAYVAELSAFVDLARGERDNPCTVEEAFAAFAVAEAATRSRLEHRPVLVDEVLAT